MGLIAGFQFSSEHALLLCGLAGLYYVAVTIANYARLRSFPGPRWTGVSNWPHSRAMLAGNCHEWYAQVNRTHGE